MTANLLTLNSSKTEFILIGLKQHFLKYTTSLTTTHSAGTVTLRLNSKACTGNMPVLYALANSR